jgi:hypothetical protein
MTPSARAATLFLAVGALLLAGSPASAQGVWTTVPSPNEVPGRNFLLGADASDVSHVWAVGRLIRPNGTGYQSRVLQHNGTAWQPAPLSGFPGDDELVDVDAVSSNEAWAVGASNAPAAAGASSPLRGCW